MTEHEFDEYLKRGMQAMPTPVGESDLAGRAMRLALSGSSAMPAAPRVARVRLFSNMLATAASLIVVAGVAVGGYLLLNQSSATSETTAADGTTVTNTTENSSDNSWATYAAGGIVLAGAVVLWGSRGQQIVVGSPAKA